MEGETITTNNLITSIKRLNVDGKEHGTIKALLKNFILPETDMAIKHNQSDKYVYTVPVKPPVSERTKSINEAKQAFLNSTVNSTAPPLRPLRKAPREPSLHYAQIAITTDEDTRSTGGGKEEKIVSQPVTLLKSKIHKPPVELPNIKKKLEHQPQARKVSFKIKNASASYRRPPVAAKQVTITSTKVSELTKKFNDLMIDSPKSTGKQSKLVKTIEDLQSASKNASNSSTPSSTLSSSPNIKIVLRHKRGSKKRNHRQRCSSMDSIDKLIISDNASAKIRVIRSQSDGTKIPKSPKKLLKYQDSSEQQSGSDSIDGPPAKYKSSESPKQKYPSERNVVKNVIEKFECEINAQSNHNNTLKRQTSSEEKKSTIPVKEKPKVPEKKSTLVLTKNIVLKDGVPKIRTIKPLPTESPKKEDVRKEPKIEVVKRKEPIYDRKRYKTNYIHADKLPMHVVDIIHEDNESMVTITNTNDEDRAACLDISKEAKTYQELTSPITPNESFLWRRKSYTPIYSDSEKSMSDSPYGFISVTMNETTITCSDDTPEISIKDESQLMETISESQVVVPQSEGKRDSNSDFESNLVEAYNKGILVGYTSKPKKQEMVEDDYEPLEPRNVENVLVIPIKSIDRSSKINCPLPEIPKQKTPPESPESNGKGNIYQCLLEMRSHPEGDESSLHNYELCDEQLEERTRGDGDSDDGYEYCKSPIKPYCHTSSTGIQIAEHYQPFPTTGNSKNYAISKSVSGASTASYEKIGSDRIYEKIPTRPPKSKDSSPNSNRHSMVSDYNGYNENENIYDTIKHADTVSLSHCYESIPNSPSMVKMRTNLRKQVTSAAQKRLSFDTVSNVSLSTISSEQKTNSIYGQRSVISFNGQEIAFQVPSSEVSVSGSDRSDDWVDISDEEKSDEQKIIIVRERSRGRKSPISWSQKVRHQWQHTPKQRPEDKGKVACKLLQL
ncbi:hypothetical protein O0L34_g6837 [Tuta absoluta]|nr:hypothetical protein O0L34_g6837 [Tuta absoluta]